MSEGKKELKILSIIRKAKGLKASLRSFDATFENLYKDIERAMDDLDFIQLKMRRSITYKEKNKVVINWCKATRGIKFEKLSIIYGALDLDIATDVNKWWAYCGQTTPFSFKKGNRKENSRYNRDLKTLCLSIMDDFLAKGNKFYGKIYYDRKEYEVEKNNNVEYREQAFNILKILGIKSRQQLSKSNNLQILSSGKLTPLHIDKRVRRYVVKIFLSHLYDIKYKEKYGNFQIKHKGGNYIEIPNIELIEFEKNKSSLNY